ncbi:MAG: phage portal protein, partial [Clostridiales bacterium]|nr:phage portal protein [Clostridiales bacterium]
MMTLDREAFLSQPLQKLLPPLIQAFGAQRPRLDRLHRYAQGRHDILLRTRPEGLPNQRLTHGFPRYIAQLMAGYLLGEPVRYEDPQQPDAVDALNRLYRAGGAEQADMELAYQQSVYGRAVSLCYHGADGQPRVAALDPRYAFVVRDDTVEQRPLMGVLLTG